MPKRLDTTASGRFRAPGMLQLKMPQELKRHAVKMAREDHLNLSDWIRQLLWREWKERRLQVARKKA